MQMVRMITTAEHQYAGRRLRAGDEYDCEEIHVPLMRKMKWSREVEATYSKVKRGYKRRDMKAAD